MTSDGSTVAESDRDGLNPRQIVGLLGFRNVSALWILLAIVVVFSLLTPRTFLTAGTWLNLLDANTVIAMTAVAALIPLTVGVFNLAIGSEVGFAVILVTVLQVNAGLPPAVAVVVTMVAGGLIGAATGLIITRLKVDSFIATLGTSSVLLAGISFLSADRQIIGLSPAFLDLANGGIPIPGATTGQRITVPMLLTLALGFAVWYVLQRTPAGRRMYATGFNAEGARLSGVPVERLRVLSLVAGGVIAGLAGSVLSSRIGAGDPTVGLGLLLPALTAVFLGSTQFSGGRFNVWGTLLSVYVLAVGVKGLQLLGAQNWVANLFNGVALLGAVALSRWERRTSAGRAPWQRTRRRAAGLKAER